MSSDNTASDVDTAADTFSFFNLPIVRYFRASATARSNRNTSSAFNASDSSIYVDLSSRPEELVFSYGPLIWASKGTFEEILNFTRHTCPGGSRLRLNEGKKKRRSDPVIMLYGELSPEELNILRETLREIFSVATSLLSGLREIYVVPQLGTVYDIEEKQSRLIRAFAPDPQGRLLIDRAVCSRVREVQALFQDLFERHQHFLQERQDLNQYSWESGEKLRARYSRMSTHAKGGEDAPYGTLRGRPIIERDSKILNGVYLHTRPGGAVVVSASSKELGKVYGLLRMRIGILREYADVVTDFQKLREANQVVQATLKENSEHALRTLLDVNRIGLDEEISLDHFISSGVGTSAHKALLAGALIEALIRDQELNVSARVSIDRSWEKGEPHSWIRYKGGNSEIVIVDPEHNYCGLLDGYDTGRRCYLRSEDFDRIKISLPL